jgi:hypothetical protein
VAPTPTSISGPEAPSLVEGIRPTTRSATQSKAILQPRNISSLECIAEKRNQKADQEQEYDYVHGCTPLEGALQTCPADVRFPVPEQANQDMTIAPTTKGAVRNVVGIRCGAISGNMRVSFQAARSIPGLVLSDKPERACEGCWSEGVQAES